MIDWEEVLDMVEEEIDGLDDEEGGVGARLPHLRSSAEES